MLYRILRRRYHFKSDADQQGIPHSTEFLYRGDRRSQINGSKTTIMFTVADTERMRYHVKHSDELGLNGGFPLWPFLCIFKIKVIIFLINNNEQRAMHFSRTFSLRYEGGD